MQLGVDIMNINQKIECALSDIVNKNIWPLSCPLETNPDEYIVYLPELETPSDFGDNKPIEWTHYMQVHWFKKGKNKKPVNYIEKRKSIRSLLENSGLNVSDIDTYYEKDTGYTHLVFSCNAEEELDG